MGSLGMQEIIVIFLIALIIFGPRKLPEIGKTIGKGLAEFKKASNELKQTWEDEVRLDKEKEAILEPIPGTTIQDSTTQGATIQDSTIQDPTIQGATIQDSTIQDPTIQGTTIQDPTIQPSEVLNENSTPAGSKENQ
jgi:sec-independent protein translocase protein TatA